MEAYAGGDKVAAAPGRAVALMRAAARVQPHIWTTSYQRGRLLGAAPKPSPETVTLHITDACPLGCSFCFAARAEKLPPLTHEELRGTLEFFRGASRVILVGGEPLCYAGLADVLSGLAGCAGEYEIFTNGLALLEGGSAAGELIAKCGAPVWFTLPLDRFHREQIGAEKFTRILDAALSLCAAGAKGLKFNLTDEEFHSHGYLNYKHVRGLLDGYHRGVREMFDGLFREGRIGDVFYFNPVVGHGSGGGCSGTPLGAGELLRGAEAVAGRRRGDGRVAVMKHLSALWMEPVPDALAAGFTGDGADEIILDGLLADALGFADAPWVRAAVKWLAGDGDEAKCEALAAIGGEDIDRVAAEALRAGDEVAVAQLAAAAPAWRRFTGWPGAAREDAVRLAARAKNIMDAGQQFAVAVSARPGGAGLPREAAEVFIDLCEQDGKLRACAVDAARRVVELRGQGLGPVQDGTKFYLGKILEDGSPPSPVAGARLMWSGMECEGDAQTRIVSPAIEFTRDGGLRVWLEFVKFEPEGRGGTDDAWKAFVKLLASVFNRAGRGAFIDELRAAGLGAIAEDYEDAAGDGSDAPDDALLVFGELFFDARAGAPMWDNPQLMRLIDAAKLDKFTGASVERLKAEAATRARLHGGAV